MRWAEIRPLAIGSVQAGKIKDRMRSISQSSWICSTCFPIVLEREWESQRVSWRARWGGGGSSWLIHNQKCAEMMCTTQNCTLKQTKFNRHTIMNESLDIFWMVKTGKKKITKHYLMVKKGNTFGKTVCTLKQTEIYKDPQWWISSYFLRYNWKEKKHWLPVTGKEAYLAHTRAVSSEAEPPRTEAKVHPSCVHPMGRTVCISGHVPLEEIHPYMARQPDHPGLVVNWSEEEGEIVTTAMNNVNVVSMCDCV